MKLFVFPTPLEAHCELLPDPTGAVIVGQPDVHETGRPGQSFTLPELPQDNGAQLTIAANGYVAFHGRGVLHLDGDASYLRMDDFHLAKGISLPRLAVNGQFLGQVE